VRLTCYAQPAQLAVERAYRDRLYTRPRRRDSGHLGALRGPQTRHALVLVATIVTCAVMYPASTRLARVVKINFTDSMPLGVYLVRPAPIDRQRIVVACPPEGAARLGLANGYLATGSCASGAAPVLKYVAAIGGSEIRVNKAGIAVDGRVLANSSAHRLDRRGRLIPRFADGTYRLAANQVWLYSPAPWSWDPRYFGPVTKDPIVGAASPVLVFAGR
jgi:conjugative transfer signal peptidase TraF